MKIKQLILIFILIIALGLTACTRSASQSPTQVPDAGATQSGSNQQPPGDLGTAVGGGFATQTAQAAMATTNEPSGEATPEAPVATPETGMEATPAPVVEPTAEPPVAPVEPTTAVGGGCTSPYIVQSGEWVWSIGRKCNISPQAIISANNLACYYDLAGRLQCPIYAGTKLILPENAPPFVGP